MVLLPPGLEFLPHLPISTFLLLLHTQVDVAPSQSLLKSVLGLGDTSNSARGPWDGVPRMEPKNPTKMLEFL